MSVLESVVLSDRAATLAEFEDFLRTADNRDGRPFEEGTISAYVSPGKNLDAWLTAKGSAGISPSPAPRRSTGTSASTTLSTAKAEHTLFSAI